MLDRMRSILKSHKSALLYCGASTIGALVYGYDNTYYNGVLAMQQFKNDYGTERDANGNLALSPSFQSATASCIYIGDLLGAILAAPVNDRWGRKASLLLASLCIVCGGIVQVADTHFEAVIIVGRILIGLGVGQFTVTSLLYIGEIAPTEIRGPAIMSYQFLQSWSQLIASALTQGTEGLNSSLSYKLPMGGLIVLPLLMFVALPFMPESPVWYMAKDRVSDAESVLRRLHRGDPTYDPATDLATLASVQRVSVANKMESTWGALLFDPIERTKVIWSAGAMYSQQICGILFFYVYGVVFVQSIGIDQPFLVQLIQNILQICAVTVSMATANQVARRTNLLVTTSMMFLAFIVIGSIGTQHSLSTAEKWVIVVVSFVIVCVINYGLSTVAYTVAREMAVGPNQNKIMSISIVTFYFGGWLVTFTAPYLYYNAGLGPMVAFVYAGTTLTSLTWIWFCVGETTGRTNWEIAKLFEKRVPARKWSSYTIQGGQEDIFSSPKELPVSLSHLEVVPRSSSSV
ncbi:general substrate transporter [Lipomyces orientalis]|uniref:General substrate transporter n=1 Tax=Lipomyces orientalis TaxID=1233043 RepID=A0ACC3TFA5_9ASCO